MKQLKIAGSNTEVVVTCPVTLGRA